MSVIWGNLQCIFIHQFLFTEKYTRQQWTEPKSLWQVYHLLITLSKNNRLKPDKTSSTLLLVKNIRYSNKQNLPKLSLLIGQINWWWQLKFENPCSIHPSPTRKLPMPKLRAAEPRVANSLHKSSVVESCLLFRSTLYEIWLINNLHLHISIHKSDFTNFTLLKLTVAWVNLIIPKTNGAITDKILHTFILWQFFTFYEAYITLLYILI